MPSITIYCEAGHYFSGSTLHEFLKTKKCKYCGKPPKPKKGVVCKDCRGYIEHARSSYAKCVACHNKPKTCSNCRGNIESPRGRAETLCQNCDPNFASTEKEEYDMMTPRKPIKKHFIVKAAPSNGKVSGGDVTAYKTKAQADAVAENLASKEQKTFIIYEAINSFRVARAEESPIVEEEHPAPIDCDIDDCEICAKGPWHDDDTNCDDPGCPKCQNCKDASCGNCRACNARLDGELNA